MSDTSAISRASDAGTSCLDGLTDAQRAAVETVDGPLLVLAGAGTGKTRVLTTRIAHIVATGRAWPSQILAVTFTNKAAREMRDRVAAMTGDDVEGLWIGTFHAVAARMLRRHAELAGLKADFTILDPDDQTRLVKQVLDAESIDPKRWPPRVVRAAIDRFKDRGLSPDRLGADDAGDLVYGRIDEIYRMYQERLATLNSADFGDLLLHCVNVFSSNAEVLANWQERFRYILVDEYQDSNVAQYLWLRLLAQGRRNICCVGDDDQSIYSWRGAEVGNILRFEKDFEGARVIRLERNYRSTQPILAAASQMIAHNRERLGKTLWTDVEHGTPVEVHLVTSGEDEARFVCDEIAGLQREGVSLNEIAILVRAGFQMLLFEERMLQAEIPYRVFGGPRFFERQEIRDALAYIRVIVQPDDDLALERIVNVPRRGIGDATLQRLRAFARSRAVSLHEAALRMTGTDDLGTRARKEIRDLMTSFARWRDRVGTDHHAELVKTVLDESGYTGMWQTAQTPDAPGRLENLKELVATLNDFESLAEFLEHVSLVMDRDRHDDRETVSLMTLHAAKGLEFAHVFLPGWEEEIFPNGRALAEGGNRALEEERRLAYVGITRAKRRVWISRASGRRVYNKWIAGLPSRFIRELPSEHVEQFVRSRRHGTRRARETPDRPGAGPGLQRLRSAGETPARPEAGKRDPVDAGTRIFHQKYGYGTVRANDGGQLEVSFEKAGVKKVFEDFVRTA